MIVAVVAAAGLVVGALLPRVIAAVPDRAVVGPDGDPPASDGEPPASGGDLPVADDASGDQSDPPPTPYRQLAAAPRLSLLLALATAAVWALIAVARSGADEDLAAYLFVGALGVAMGYVDLREHRLPDWLTFPALAGAGVLLAVAAALTGEWAAYGRAWLAAATSVAFYFALALIRPSDLGFGDVKLAASLGLLLGWVGWTTAALGVFLAFLAGGLVGIVLLVAGRATRRTSLPFGPPMLVGALAALLWNQLAM